MKRKNNLGKWLAAVMIFLLVLTFGAALFFVLRPVFIRFSMDFYYPVLKAVRTAERFSAEKALLSLDKNELARALTRLRQENLVLEAENAAMYRFRQEYAELRMNAGMKPPPEFRAVCAEVLLRDPASWKETFTIDRGRGDGIREGDLVVATCRVGDRGDPVTGVVGRIHSASNHSAVVATLLSSDCTLGTTQAESGVYGILCGTGGEALISSLPVNARYGVGEIVMTSGFSEAIPAGIAVGSVAADGKGAPAVRKTRDGLSAEARMIPLLDLDSLRFVVVLSRSGQP